MCGISGFAGTLYSSRQLEVLTQHACKLLRHRGPDQIGTFAQNEIALGCSRLAIQDPEEGRQPMCCEGYTLVFNGELYNGASLKSTLSQHGVIFHTKCDTEILLKGLIKFGDMFLEKIEGMFAFAIWDEKSQTLTLARDRWGEKPLYYSVQGNCLTFASEIKGLKPWPHLQWEVSEEDIMIFLKNSYLQNPRTGWKNIYKLAQGSFLRFQKGQLTIMRFFTPSLQISLQPVYPETLFKLLESNVKKCMISDRPVGAFLSGGLDSTTMAYFLTQENPEAPIFSLHWDDPEYSEEPYTTTAAKALHLNHSAIKCDPKFFVDHFDTIVDLYDEPFGDESIVPTYCLAKFAKEKVDVVLTGDGADEFFHGYERYFFDGNFDHYLETFAATPASIMELICSSDLPASLFPMTPYFYSTERARSWIDINTYLTDDILMKVDRACMGVSLESRCPFLTPEITHFALQCSLKELTSHNGRGKEILRKAMKTHLPPVILERKKMGFGVPLNTWFRSSLKEWMLSRLLHGQLLKTGWFSEKGIQTLISLHDSNQGHFARPLLNLLVLERWIKKLEFNPAYP